jgi:hypothetical protein
MLSTIYEQVKEIHVVNELEANLLLKTDEWVLLKVVSEVEKDGATVTRFVVGRKTKTPPKAEFIPASKYKVPLQDIANELPWRRGKFNEWCFARQNGAPVCQELENAIKAAGGKLSLGGYIYSVSGENGLFFNRKKDKSETGGLT